MSETTPGLMRRVLAAIRRRVARKPDPEYILEDW